MSPTRHESDKPLALSELILVVPNCLVRLSPNRVTVSEDNHDVDLAPT